MKRFLIPLLLLLCLSCAVDEKPPLIATTQARTWWFRLNEGELEGIDLPQATDRRLRKPWTVQQRIADFANYDSALYAAVNGYGVAMIQWDGDTAPTYNYIYYPDIFQYRTFIQMLPREDAILCHFYFNTQLNIINREELSQESINLIQLRISGGDYDMNVLHPPFQRLNPRWELKTLLPEDENFLFFEWKLSEERFTDFSYSRFNLSQAKEIGITREAFRRSYWSDSQERNSIQEDLHDFMIWLTSKIGDQGSYHFLVRSESSPVVHRYRIEKHQGQSDVRTVRIYSDKDPDGIEIFYALGPGGVVYRNDRRSGATPGAYILPDLPDGYFYTDLYVDRGNLILSWEEADFTQVGSAGLLFVADPVF